MKKNRIYIIDNNQLLQPLLLSVFNNNYKYSTLKTKVISPILFSFKNINLFNKKSVLVLLIQKIKKINKVRRNSKPTILKKYMK